MWSFSDVRLIPTRIADSHSQHSFEPGGVCRRSDVRTCRDRARARYTVAPACMVHGATMAYARFPREASSQGRCASQNLSVNAGHRDRATRKRSRSDTETICGLSQTRCSLHGEFQSGSAVHQIFCACKPYGKLRELSCPNRYPHKPEQSIKRTVCVRNRRASSGGGSRTRACSTARAVRCASDRTLLASTTHITAMIGSGLEACG